MDPELEIALSHHRMKRSVNEDTLIGMAQTLDHTQIQYLNQNHPSFSFTYGCKKLSCNSVAKCISKMTFAGYEIDNEFCHCNSKNTHFYGDHCSVHLPAVSENEIAIKFSEIFIFSFLAVVIGIFIGFKFARKNNLKDIKGDTITKSSTQAPGKVVKLTIQPNKGSVNTLPYNRQKSYEKLTLTKNNSMNENLALKEIICDPIHYETNTFYKLNSVTRHSPQYFGVPRRQRQKSQSSVDLRYTGTENKFKAKILINSKQSSLNGSNVTSKRSSVVKN